ncbi:23S rRNA (uracil1939-C5)-methyltransferase [Bryocella elongata]|uniref:23S rRNA (Uracil1939-C5)-methyltransferase n=1 Tax=Bryocella elongata TaxID=863522 RepID=A0A1H6AJ82_9BACT|nr:23S rRNA (uracil(1939)-C(5))-methyltransferase RlmD [Bryocella elongata]SEG48147.1 23S rRNA (uracil1939-C5)-methyltransferase [Bryocella elongata]
MIDLTQILDAPAEVDARCPHFGACGGCQLQHLRYETQLAHKQTALLALFAEAGLDEIPTIVPHSAGPWHYRNRIRLRIERVEGQFRFGYNRRASHVFLPVIECPIAAEPLWGVAAALLELAKTDATAEALLDVSAELELFANHKLSRLQLTFFARDKRTKSMPQFERVMVALQEVVGIELLDAAALVYADPQSGRIVRTLSEHGADGLGYRVKDESYWISRGGFFQVNRFLLDTLVDQVTRNGGAPRAGALAWDLFSGVGLFSRPLARSFDRVTAVEANPTAVEDLRRALKKISPASTAIAATTVEFLRRAIVDRDRPSLVVLDPPRAGAGVEACELLVKLAPQEIVYVSCDPTTLARDLAVLMPHYKLTGLHMVDLFPQTVHVESIAVLNHR